MLAFGENLTHQNCIFFNYSEIVLPKLKFAESTVFEIIDEGGGPAHPPLVEGVGTKYLRTGKVKV